MNQGQQEVVEHAANYLPTANVCNAEASFKKRIEISSKFRCEIIFKITINSGTHAQYQTHIP